MSEQKRKREAEMRRAAKKKRTSCSSKRHAKWLIIRAENRVALPAADGYVISVEPMYSTQASMPTPPKTQLTEI
jgi:hypothetical protein